MPPLSGGVKRVLIVDDSAVARQAVSRAITASAGLQVAGIAQDGQVALERIVELKPDGVVLDLQMPVMDGITFLRQLRSTNPTLPVVVFSTMTSAGATATLEAMNAGATAYVLKPSALRGSGTGDVDTELIPVLQAVLQSASPSAVRPRLRPAPNTAGAVVIAVSTGGPTALQTLLPALPPDLGVPVLVVQHMPATFTALLARRLDERCALSVVEATDGQPITSGTIYIAPGGRHLSVTGTGAAPRVLLTDDPPVNSCRPAADVLFETAARVFAGPVLGVVLTGMGVDGRQGAAAVTAAGGAIIAQDPATAVVGSMPQAVIEAGLAYSILPIDDIAAEVTRRTRAGRPT